MTELCFRMVSDINLDLPPIPFVVSYLLTRCADGQQSAECLNFCQRFLEVLNKSFSLLFHALTFAYFFIEVLCVNDRLVVRDLQAPVAFAEFVLYPLPFNSFFF